MSLICRQLVPGILRESKKILNIKANSYGSRVYSGNAKDSKLISNDVWRKRLTPDEYHVTREKGTEPPFSGKYYNHSDEGVYKCICCSSDLFSSSEKYESHCGWPSFFSPITAKLQEGENPVKTKLDTDHGMIRTEVLCSQCDAHLGHVFNDGPEPTGQRYCINSVALKFIPKER